MDAIVRADAFNLPFRDESFAVVVADPPYAGKNRGKKGVGYRAAGYVPYAGREWWAEAWRVLQPAGHLYVFCAVRELWDWFEYCTNGARAPKPIDVISWCAPNNPSLSAYWRRGTGGRAPAWRPVLQWQKEPLTPIKWPADPGVYVFGGERPLRTRTGKLHSFVDPNVFITSSIQSNMHEAEAWPNQLPVRLIKWLLRPHAAGGVVLDLFSGTGTTRVAAISLGLVVVSVEISTNAIQINRRRGAQTALQR